MSTAIIKKNQVQAVAGNLLPATTGVNWTTDQVALVKRTICKGASDDELALFLNICGKTGLDPFLGQIYAVMRGTPPEMTIQTGIGGLRSIADATGKYIGQEGPFWCGKDGKWVDVWLSQEPPAAAKVGVLRTGFVGPVWGIALWRDYAKDGKDGFFWRKSGPHMLAKCAEAGAFRKAYPQKLSKLYTSDEMPSADSRSDQERVEPEPAPPPIEVWENYVIPSPWLPESLRGKNGPRVTYQQAATNRELGFVNNNGAWNTLREYMEKAWKEAKQIEIYLLLANRYPSKPEPKVDKLERTEPEDASGPDKNTFPAPDAKEANE